MTVYWDDHELPFDSLVSDRLPTPGEIESLVAHKLDLIWVYKGLRARLPHEVLATGLADYKAWKQGKQFREKLPPHVGKFLWGQTEAL